MTQHRNATTTPQHAKLQPVATKITATMQRLAKTLFGETQAAEDFLAALAKGQSKESALIILQNKPEINAFPKYKPEAWQPDFVVRLMDGFGFRPSQHPLYASGAIYSLDFSSVFAASLMLEIESPPKRILDLCSAPGGKAIFAARAFDPDLLTCNEVIRKRTGSLIDNLTRCKIACSEVGSADPSVWAKKCANQYDFVIVDAPCSGQSLIAKGDEALGCFSPQMIDLNVGRQRRITGNAIHCVRPGGHMLYMTCTYTPKENEKVIDWLLKEYPDLRVVESKRLARFRSHLAEFPCYRMFPQDGAGAGAFAALLRRGDVDEEIVPSDDRPVSWRYGDPPRSPRPEPKPAVAPTPFPDATAKRRSKRPVPRRSASPKRRGR